MSTDANSNMSMSTTESGGNRTIAAVAHLVGLLPAIGSAVILLITEDDELVRENATNALNFQLGFLIAAIAWYMLLPATLFVLVFEMGTVGLVNAGPTAALASFVGGGTVLTAALFYLWVAVPVLLYVGLVGYGTYQGLDNRAYAYPYAPTLIGDSQTDTDIATQLGDGFDRLTDKYSTATIVGAAVVGLLIFPLGLLPLVYFYLKASQTEDGEQSTLEIMTVVLLNVVGIGAVEFAGEKGAKVLWILVGNVMVFGLFVGFFSLIGL